MEIRTGSLILRCVEDDDINEVARMWNFEKGEISLEDAKEAIDWMAENHRKNNEDTLYHLCLAIFEADSPRIIGWCGLDGRDNRRVNLFYLIDKAYRRKGYATACARKIIECGFTRFLINRIDGQCHKDNLGSKRVIEKIGMRNTVPEDDGSFHRYVTIEEYYREVLE